MYSSAKTCFLFGICDNTDFEVVSFSGRMGIYLWQKKCLIDSRKLRKSMDTNSVKEVEDGIYSC
jgi:hypothetical protein